MIDINKNEVYQGDCAEVMKELPENCIDLTITSPPYDDLRNYEGYQFNYEAIIEGLLRVTKKGGVVVWVIGDAVIKGGETGTSFKHALKFIEKGFRLHDTMIYEKNTSSFPARRNGIRYTQIFEYMFVFSKDTPKTVSLICDKENKWAGWTNWGKKTERGKDGVLIEKKDIKPVQQFSPRNNIWRYVVGGNFGQKDKTAYQHPATFPEDLVKDHIITWSKVGDLVLDPMCGSGTTGKVALQEKRKFIGIEISKKYCEMSKERIGLRDMISDICPKCEKEYPDDASLNCPHCGVDLT